MKRRVTVESLETRLIRGDEVLVGRAVVVEKDGRIMTVDFSRRDGEKYWTADSAFSDEMPLFRSPVGSRRSGTSRVLAGWVALAVDNELAGLLEGSGSCCSQKSMPNGSVGRLGSSA